MNDWVCSHAKDGRGRHTVTFDDTIFWLCPDCWAELIEIVFEKVKMDVKELHEKLIEGERNEQA